jgi:hypothetical protein
MQHCLSEISQLTRVEYHDSEKTGDSLQWKKVGVNNPVPQNIAEAT